MPVTFHKQQKLPFSPINYFRKQREIKKMGMDNIHAVELTLPGLMNVHSVTINIKCIGLNKYAVVTGEIFDEKHYAKLGYQLSTYKVVKFEEFVILPPNAIDATPTAVLTVAKDNCGNHTDGILRLEWTLTEVPVPIEIKNCGEED